MTALVPQIEGGAHAADATADDDNKLGIVDLNRTGQTAAAKRKRRGGAAAPARRTGRGACRCAACVRRSICMIMSALYVRRRKVPFPFLARRVIERRPIEKDR